MSGKRLLKAGQFYANQKKCEDLQAIETSIRASPRPSRQIGMLVEFYYIVKNFHVLDKEYFLVHCILSFFTHYKCKLIVSYGVGISYYFCRESSVSDRYLLLTC